MINFLRLLLLCSLVLSQNSFAQERFTISGTVSEAASNETLIGVTIAVPELRTGVTTNEYGFYSITLPKGAYNIQVSYLGFKDVTQKVNLSENKKINFQLEESAQELQEVVVTEDVEKMNIRKPPQMSVNAMSVETIKKIPVILGEAMLSNLFCYFRGLPMPGKEPQVSMFVVERLTKISFCLMKLLFLILPIYLAFFPFLILMPLKI